jgi:hypothetical protein
MTKRTRSKKPIMTADEERFMAFEGLLQWTQAVVTQSARVSAARDHELVELRTGNRVAGHLAVLDFHSECHFFVVAAYKLTEYQEWVLRCGLCATIDFTEINGYSKQDIKDLRDMREHVVNYFRGEGFAPDRWVVETPEYKADASAVNGTMIGGRLDWIKFGAAAARLLEKLIAEPIPYPPR